MLYTINRMQVTGNEMLTVSLDYDSAKTKVCTTGFNRQEFGPKSTQGKTCSGEATLFVLGEKTDFVVEGYEDYSMRSKNKNFNYEIKEEVLDVKSYLARLNDEVKPITSDTTINQNIRMNIRLQAFDESLTANHGYSSARDIRKYETIHREITVFFNASFAPNEKKRIAVNCNTFTSMDRQGVKNELKPVFTEHYIFQIPDNRSGVEQTKINIIPNETAKYLVQSNLDFSQDELGIYHASVKGYPDKNLIVQMHADKVVLKKDFPYLIFLASFLLLLTAGFTISMIALKKMR